MKQWGIVYAASTETKSSSHQTANKGQKEKQPKTCLVIVKNVAWCNVDFVILDLESLVALGDPDCEEGKDDAKNDEAHLNIPIGTVAPFDANYRWHRLRTHAEVH